MRVGLLGGTFNPPHIGHLVCAQEAWAQLGLDRVLLLPVFSPPHKEADGDPGVEVRVALCEAAVAGDERLGVSRAEADVPGRSYTVDTLNRLHDARPEDQLTFIVGGDMAASLPQWREPRAILELCTIGAAARDGVGREELLERLDSELPGASPRIQFFDMPRIDVSSTLIRRRVAAGEPVRYLVPDAVAAQIEREGLYR
ncbi:MAG: nicotinate (nicotinamide) nucleotide adenylyltransferase [Agromyces sp.]|nr:nicotinate (nicotinamide) nucleotide adenylyltransferase [Agromyces sp.]